MKSPPPKEQRFAGRDFSLFSPVERLHLRHAALNIIRRFFSQTKFVEVETPIRVLSPGIDPYIDAFPLDSGFFLATSPELEMKKLLASGMERIFQITRSFRAGEKGDIHHPEFSLLEWYETGRDYRHLMTVTEQLVRAVGEEFAKHGIVSPLRSWPMPFPRVSVRDAFIRYADWDPVSSFDADPFFVDLTEKVEPALAGMGAVFLFDYPEEVGSLARARADAPGVCERFELYLGGLEICNGFSELTDPAEQARRFARDNDKRVRLGKSPYPVDRSFLDALESGLPECAGNALGIDRLILALTGAKSLEEVSLLSGRGRIQCAGKIARSGRSASLTKGNAHGSIGSYDN